MRTWTQRVLGQVSRPERYAETLIESQGVPIVLSLWRSGTAGEAERRGTVVFVPGTMMHPLFYADALEAVSDAGWHVVGVHPQGHGKSPRVARTLRWATVVANAVDAARATRAHVQGPVLLMGSSQGALVALLAAADVGPTVTDGVLVHNLFDPARPESVEVTRYPPQAARFHHAVRSALGFAGKLLPGVPVPISAYLRPSQVFGDPASQQWFEEDPLALHSYPLRFVADMVNADTRALRDGSLRVPVTVLATRHDPLFPLAGIEAAYAELRAPRKELVVLDSHRHLIYQEEVEIAVAATLSALDGLCADGGR